MGVTGLWTVVQPCARPIKIETLNKKRLAVDASIWIYQFLKAVRDKEGNALRNSHVVGFFRRICKLLFIGIKPVFVFDGGAPALKRQTISGRKQRREGRRDDATRTAGKLLALQMQRLAEEEEQKRLDDSRRPPEPEEELPDNFVYVDELQMTQQERQQNRKFKKKDQYHLPDLDMSMAEMGGPNDPRIMSLEELEAYARQFDTGEDINVYDFSKIDFDSAFFVSLPASDRYNILNAARLRSRLRMGYSKEQLDTMFPDRMAFSKFQIERVTERNELTQRLMNINGMNDDAMFGVNGSGRIAGEKGREYVLVKNDGVEGGWALGVVTSKEEGQQSKPIDVDSLDNLVEEEEEDEWEDADDFEDVPIEGLNRLPRKATTAAQEDRPSRHSGRRRPNFSGSRAGGHRKRPTALSKTTDEDPDSLFVADEREGDIDATPEIDAHHETEVQSDSEDEDLSRAIAMSMEGNNNDEEQADWLDTFQQTRADEARPLPKGRGQAIAHIVNSRAGKLVPAQSATPTEDNGNEIEKDFQQALKSSWDTEQEPKPVPLDQLESDSDEDDMDLQAALTESRRTKHQPKRTTPARPDRVSPSVAQKPSATVKKSGFDGPLPFEKLDLGSSLLGKKKMEKLQEESAGGFERPDQGKKTKKSEPLPPWFEGSLDDDMAAQKAIEKEDRQKAKQYQENYQFTTELPTLRRQPSGEVIDLEVPDQLKTESAIFTINSSDDEVDTKADAELASRPSPGTNHQPAMGEIADALRAEPPVLSVIEREDVQISNEPLIRRASNDQEALEPRQIVEESSAPAVQLAATADSDQGQDQPQDSEDEQFEWEESEKEDDQKEQPSKAVQGADAASVSKSSSPEFEDVDMTNAPTEPVKPTEQNGKEVSSHVTGLADQNMSAEAGEDDYGYYTDSEDDELMRQLAVEAEEHARFASTLNNKTQQQNVADYERELKQLRSQQKKDRRDADEVTHVMIQECQQLLKLFGLPYITAPMEAEAQCAELVTLGLVDGIVTDDSDCFLFGGTRIYKNMFNQAKFVECYLTSDLEKEFDLTRQKLIGIAHLLGSDYTEGLTGVGPVSALEILSEFPSLDDFRDWWSGVQMNTIPKSEDVGNPFRKKFRRNATKLFLPPAFPDPRVELAYLKPEVDSDPSPFQWGVPDLDALRSFLMATIGWTQERTDEVLVPVIRDMNQRQSEGTQSNITAFFEGGVGAGAYAPRKRVEQGSKRMGNALDRMAQRAKRKRKGTTEVEESAEMAEEEPAPAPKKKTKRGGRRTAAVADEDRNE
ncbi:hypothetical protein MBLNU459_g8500t1 [Dothideomycetes sp. NU459]